MFVLNLYDFAHMYEQKICHGRIGAGEYTLRIHLRGTLNVQAIPSYPFRMRWRFEWKSPLNWLNCSRWRNTSLIHSLNHKTGKFHPRTFLIRSRKMSPTANQCSRQTQLCWATRQRKEITLAGERGCFIVESLNGMKYCVTLLKDGSRFEPTSGCRASRDCYHIQAAILCVGYKREIKQIKNVANLLKSQHRQHHKRSGAGG